MGFEGGGCQLAHCREFWAARFLGWRHLQNQLGNRLWMPGRQEQGSGWIAQKTLNTFSHLICIAYLLFSMDHVECVMFLTLFNPQDNLLLSLFNIWWKRDLENLSDLPTVVSFHGLTYTLSALQSHWSQGREIMERSSIRGASCF